ncbi:MFS transporter [Candidatus Sulfidibacterium hydrothermale]|uniref:MFS transporter n=1 Tax=Candidatus Sulfidibacterium hydrothermale TaxID=2875962 RepID=UPI001F0AC84A|nr:MFS transporter [Candidatus Sulfidibacterium hydrothermale]UBM61051.1 MFS transporter [Candidatus Sulfidibacterium hydrothermale]
MKNENFNRKKVFTVSSAHFLHDVYSSFLSPLLPLLIKKYGIDLSDASWLSLLQRIPSLFSAVLGTFAHKIPWRPIIILAPLVTAISGSLLGTAPNLFVLAILLFTIGVSSAIFHVPAPVIIKDFSGKRTGKGMSYYMLGGESARMLGPLLVVSAVSWWGLEGTWRLAIPAVVASVILSFLLEKIPYESVDKTNQTSSLQWKKTLKQYSGFFVALTIYMLFRSVMRAGLSVFLPTYMVGTQGNSLLFSAFSLSVMQATAVAGTFLSGRLSDIIGRFTMLLILAILSPIFMFTFLWSGPALQMVSLLFLGFVLAASTPVLLALVQEQGSNQPAFMNGSFTTINFISSAVSVLAVGYIGDAAGLKETFLLSGFLAIAAIPAVFFLKKKSRSGTPPPPDTGY